MVENLTLHKMKISDINELYENLHLKYVKKYHENQLEEKRGEYQRWYEFLVNSPHFYIFTVKDDKNILRGLIKYEFSEKKAIVNIFLHESIRGKKYAKSLLEGSMNKIKKIRKIEEFHAYILKENLASISLFKSLDFKFIKNSNYNGIRHCLYIKRLKDGGRINMTKKERVKNIIEILEKKFGNPQCALNYKTPFELLIAVILSAQCTDKQVNIVTEKMFKEVNTPQILSELPLEKIEEYIKSTGFYKNKAKNIKRCAQQLLENYKGEVPQGMKELTELAGVGRKTANVVRGEIWGIAEGITVDTHVKRLSNLIGLVKEDDPLKIELALMKIVPKEFWIKFAHFLILQGRDKCIARRPKCNECEIKSNCLYYLKK